MNIHTRQKISKVKFYIGPEGKLYYIRLLKEFCAEYKLSVRQMRKLAFGGISEYKGWTFLKKS